MKTNMTPKELEWLSLARFDIKEYIADELSTRQEEVLRAFISHYFPHYNAQERKACKEYLAKLHAKILIKLPGFFSDCQDELKLQEEAKS